MPILRKSLSNRDRLWRAMRQLRRFDLRQLQLATATTETTAGKYVRGLCRSGYIAKRAGRYVLIRDSGPKPPRFRTSGAPHFTLIGVEDLNTRTRYGVEDGPDPGNSPRFGRHVPPQPKSRHWFRHKAGGAS